MRRCGVGLEPRREFLPQQAIPMCCLQVTPICAKAAFNCLRLDHLQAHVEGVKQAVQAVAQGCLFAALPPVQEQQPYERHAVCKDSC